MSHPDRFLMAGIMGWPVMHSRSPKIHNYWLTKHGLAGTYVPLAIPAEGLRAALRALPALGFAGCNLTIPHKEAAFEIVDRVDPVARRIGAINCVVAAPRRSRGEPAASFALWLRPTARSMAATTTASATFTAFWRPIRVGRPTPARSL